MTLRVGHWAALAAVLAVAAAPAEAFASDSADFTLDYVRALAVTARAQASAAEVIAAEPGTGETALAATLGDLTKAREYVTRHSAKINPAIRSSVRSLLLACDVLSRNYSEIQALQKQIRDAEAEGRDASKLAELKQKRTQHVESAWSLVTESAASVVQALVRYPEGSQGELTLSADERDSLLFELDALFPDVGGNGRNAVHSAALRIRKALRDFPPSGEAKPYIPEEKKK